MAEDEQNSANLRKLSDCLNQASNIIDVILQQPSATNTAHPSQSTQNDQATSEIARNRSCETSSGSSQHVSIINSAVNRARLMIQQSSSKGLYSRLGKKERLRATKPATESTAKKPRVVNEEKPKVFEFVLLHIGEHEDTENIVYEESMVALRGFIEVKKAATEKDIREKLGEAIRLKFPLVTNSDFEFVRASRRRITKPVTVGEYNYQQIKMLAGQGSIYLKMKDGFDCMLVEDELDDEFDFEKEERLSKYNNLSRNPTTPASDNLHEEVVDIQTPNSSSSSTCIQNENVGGESSYGTKESPEPTPRINSSQQLHPTDEDTITFSNNLEHNCTSSLPEKSTSSLFSKATVTQAVDECITYCKEQNISDPVEILRCAQKFIVKGKPLNGYTGDINELSDERSSFILINRLDVLGTALEEVPGIEDLQLTLEVSFYGENAQDAGGPRKEFFRLCLQEVKQKYFDNGIKEHLAEDYKVVGVIMALSALQDGKMPRFLNEDQLQAVFMNGATSSDSLSNLAQGVNKLGLCEIAKQLPSFLHLFRQSGASSLTRRKLVHLLKPQFSEVGCNQRQHENTAYTAFSKYCREAAGGKKGNVTLEHILQFTTGTDEEPVLSFAKEPSIQFVSSITSAKWSFIPTANTCSNTLYLPFADHNMALPIEVELFEVYDMAFSNAYFGNR